MSDEFEKNISHRMDGFQLSPGPQVWERVAAALPAEKNRRRFAIWWWWLLPLAACLGGGIWLIPGNQKNADGRQIADIARKAAAGHGILKKSTELIPVDTARVDTVQPEDDQSKNLISKKQNSAHQTVDIHRKEAIVNNQSKKSRQNKPLQTGNFTIIPHAEIPIYENVLLKRHSQTPAKGTEDVDFIMSQAAGNTAIKKTIISDSNFLNKEKVLPLVNLTVTPLPEVVVKMDTDLPIDRDTVPGTSVGSKTPEVKTKNKKSEWSLIVAVGKSNLANGHTDDIRKSLDANYQNSSGGLTGTIGNTIGSFSNPASGLAVSAGIVRSQTISKHFGWQAAVNYQYLTSKQSVGSRNDSLVRFDAFTSNAFYTTNRIANNPGTIRLNQIHRLQIASGIRYTLNPASTLPISFFAGASVAYNISNNLLLHDYRSRSYIRSAALSNKLMLGGEAGIDIFINHTFHAGLLYQHDFTNVGKSKIGSVFHWNQLQLRIGILLSK